MSNHWHGVVTDPSARLPEFLERFHRLFARAQNASLGRWENLWSSDKPSVVRLVNDEDILDKMAYTVANPTAAGLVRSPDEWPGVISLRIGEHSIVQMPDGFFNPGGSLPREIELVMSRPPIYPELGVTDLARHLVQAVSRRVCQAREVIAARGQTFLGAKRVLQEAFDASPIAPERKRNPRPRIAAKDIPERARALLSLLAFVRRYRDAWYAWRAGRRDVLFPVGTYALRVHARVACVPACPM
jgi:putative transposase